MPKEDYTVEGLLFTPFMREDESIDDYVEVEGLFVNEENNIYHLYNTNGEYITLKVGNGLTRREVANNIKKVEEFDGIEEATDAYMKDVYIIIIEE